MRRHLHGVDVLGADIGSIINMIYPGLGSIASGLTGGKKEEKPAAAKAPSAQEIAATERARAQAEQANLEKTVAIAAAGTLGLGLFGTIIYLIARRPA